jgi:hypothetical protein
MGAPGSEEVVELQRLIARISDNGLGSSRLRFLCGRYRAKMS